MLEAHSKGKTTDALKSLMQLAPKTATVVRDGVEQEISVDAVKRAIFSWSDRVKISLWTVK